MTRPPLDYHSALRPAGTPDAPRAGSVLRYCGGLAAGLALSAAFWTTSFSLIGINSFSLTGTAVLLLTTKGLLPASVERSAMRTGFAPGILSSIPLALLLGLFAAPIVMCGGWRP